MEISSIYDIPRISADIGEQNQFVDVVGSFINNREFSQSFQTYKNGFNSEREFIWSAMNEIGANLGDAVYENILHYIDYASNVDLCKVHALRSMYYALGINYTILNNIQLFPLDVLNIMHLMSLNRKYYLDEKIFNADFIEDIYSKCSADTAQLSDSYIDDEKFKKYVKDLYAGYLSSVVNLRYNYEGAAKIYEYEQFKQEYDLYTAFEDQFSRDLSSKILYNVKLSFNPQEIADAIEEGADSMDNYEQNERILLSAEFQRREKYLIDVLSGQQINMCDMPQTRYSYYRKRLVLDVTKFIDYKFYHDNNGISGLTVYNVDKSFFEVPSCDIRHVITFTQNGPSVDYSMIESVAESLAQMTIFISQLREKLKVQVRKNYMKGTFNLLAFLVNEYLVEYASLKQFNGLPAAREALLRHTNRPSDTDITEYWDTTEYYNIKTRNSQYSDIGVSATAERYWEDANCRDISQDRIDQFYNVTLQLQNRLSDYNDLLSAVYDLGANESFVAPDGIFHCVLSDGQQSYDVLPVLNLLSTTYDRFNTYLSSGVFKYDGDTYLSDQVTAVSSWIESDLCAQFMDGVSDIWYDNKLSIERISSDVDALSASFENLVSASRYSVYMQKSKNKYCYNNNAPNEDYSNICANYVSGWFIGNSNYCGVDGYDSYIKVRIDQLEKFTEEYDHIHNVPLSNQVNYINQEYDSISSGVSGVLNDPTYNKYLSAYTGATSEVMSEYIKSLMDWIQTRISVLYDIYRQQLESMLNALELDCRQLQSDYLATESRVDSVSIPTDESTGLGLAPLPDVFYSTIEFGEEGPIGKIATPKQCPEGSEWHILYAVDGKVTLPSQRIFYTPLGLEEENPGTPYYNVFSLYDSGSYIAALRLIVDNIKCASDYAGDIPAIEENDSLEEKTKKKIAWLEQITNAVASKVGEGESRTVMLTSVSQGFMNVGDVMTLQTILDSLKEFSRLFEKIKARAVDLKQYGFDAITVSGGLPEGLQEILNWIQKQRDKIDEIIENKDDIKALRASLKALQPYLDRAVKIEKIWDSVFSDKEQTLYLDGYYGVGIKLTKTNITAIKAYIVNTDKDRKKLLYKEIIGLQNEYRRIQNEYFDLGGSLSVKVEEVEEYYQVQYGMYIEQQLQDLCEWIFQEIAKLIAAALRRLAAEMKIVNGLLDIIVEQISKWLGVKMLFTDAVERRLDELYFFDDDWYLLQKDLFLTYTGRRFSYDQYYNWKNTVHPSHQLHPYIRSFIKDSNISKFVTDAFDNGIIEGLELKNIVRDIHKYIGEFGQTLDFAMNNIHDFTGYRTKYERSYHKTKNTVDERVSPVIDYEGTFYPPAVDAFISDPAGCIASLSCMSSDFYVKYYGHLNLTVDDCKKIAEQLSAYHDDILAIVSAKDGPSSEYDIYKYCTDEDNNMYTLYKKYGVPSPTFREKQDTPGQVWMRYENHPIGFPAFYGKCPNIVSGDYSTGKIKNLCVGEDTVNDPTKVSYFYDMEIDTYNNFLALAAYPKNDPITYWNNHIVADGFVSSYAELSSYDFYRQYQFADVIVARIVPASSNDTFRVSYVKQETDRFNDVKSYDEYAFAREGQMFPVPGKYGYCLLRMFLDLDGFLNFMYAKKYMTEMDQSGAASMYLDPDESGFTVFHKKYIGTTGGNYTAKSIIRDHLVPTEYSGAYCLSSPEIAFDYDVPNREYHFVLAPDVVGQTEICTCGLGSRCTDYPASTENPVISSDAYSMNSFDSFDQALNEITLKIKYGSPVKIKDEVHNLNADAAYIPHYPWSTGQIAIQSDVPNSVGLLGVTKNIDAEISYVNPDFDFEFDVDKIKKDYTFGRVYEDYLAADDKTLFIEQNGRIRKTADGSRFRWTLPLSNYRYGEKQIRTLQVLFVNVNTLGKNPYFMGDIMSIADSAAACHYMSGYEISSDTASSPCVTTACTYDYARDVKRVNDYDANVIDNISGITIRYDTAGKKLVIDFSISDTSIESFIPSGALRVVFYNPRDLQMFKYYHLLDAYGIVRTKVPAEWVDAEMVYDGYVVTKRVKKNSKLQLGRMSGLADRYKYSGEAVVPDVQVFNADGELLEEGVCWSKTLRNNTTPGTAMIDVTGIDPYYGSIRGSFEIVDQQRLKLGSIAGLSAYYWHTGYPVVPDISVLDLSGIALSPGTAWTMQLSNNVNVGTAQLSAIGVYPYDGTLVSSFQILDRNEHQLVSISGLSDYYQYTGEAIVPDVSVFNAYGQLIDGNNWRLQLSNNIEQGTAGVSAIGNYPYTGVVSGSFQIVDEIPCYYEVEEISGNGAVFDTGYITTTDTSMEISAKFSSDTPMIRFDPPDTVCVGHTESLAGFRFYAGKTKYSNDILCNGEVGIYEPGRCGKEVLRPGSGQIDQVIYIKIKSFNEYSRMSEPPTIYLPEEARGVAAKSIGVFGDPARHTVGVSNMVFRRLKISEAGELKMDLVPAVDNKRIPCLYDTVSHKAFYSINGKTPAATLTPLRTLLYIQNTDSGQYIDTGVQAAVSQRWKTGIQVSSVENQDNGYPFAGAGGDSGDWDYESLFCDYDGRLKVFLGGSAVPVMRQRGRVGEVLDIKYQLTEADYFGNNVCKLVVNSETCIEARRQLTRFQGKNIYLFKACRDQGEQQSGIIKFISFTVYAGQKVICDIVPVRLLNDEVCVYDKVSGRIIRNSGSGSFIGGPEYPRR